MDARKFDMIDVLADAGLRLDHDKATEEMKNSVSRFARLLICPLCNKIFNKPTTLSSCAHSFCMECIDQYSADNNELCPVKGCNMPISITGSHKGSYRKINPQLSQSIESLRVICNSLNKASDHWWLSENTIKTIKEMQSSQQQTYYDNSCDDHINDRYNRNDNFYNDCYDPDLRQKENEHDNNSGQFDGEEDDDNMIDLQQGEY